MNPSFIEEDLEYPDLDCGQFVARRYLRLIYSADYYSKPFIYEDPPDDGPRQSTISSNLLTEGIPSNLLTEGKRLTPAMKTKIFGALALCPLPSSFEIRVYQLFHLVKLFGWRYNYKFCRWELG